MKLAVASARSTRRRGTVIVQVAAGSFLMVGFAALAVDVGLLYSVKADLQNAADSAALAGASGYFSNESLAEQNESLQPVIEARTQEYALHNESFRAGGTEVDLADITLGHFDFENKHAPLDTSGDQRFNAVEVITRRAPGSANGAVLFYFARIFGMSEGDVSATAVAAMDDRFSGYRYEENEGPALMPFTVAKAIYDDMVDNGPDLYSYDDDAGVQSTGDGIQEIRLFPFKESGGGSGSDGAGNFGVLDFASGGASTVTDQIANGISEADLEATIGTSEPAFYDEAGNAVTYQINGQTGAMTTIGGDLEARVGDVIGFFVHESVVNPGSNAEFQMMTLRFGRIMHVDLTGAIDSRALLIQPVTYTGSAVSVSEYAPSTGGQIGRIVLVR